MPGFARGLRAVAEAGGLGSKMSSLMGKSVTLAGRGASNVAHRGAMSHLGGYAANVGLQGGAGAVAAGMTGDADYLYAGIGMGLAGGAGSMFRGVGKSAFSNKLLWSKRMLAGQAVGVATGSPGTGMIAAAGMGVASKFGPAIGGGFVGGTKGAIPYGLNLARAPFQPGKAFKWLARHDYPMASPAILGLAGGAAWGGAKVSAGVGGRAEDGVFMGGTSYAGPNGRAMGINHLETAGLTLALHRGNATRLNRIM